MKGKARGYGHRREGRALPCDWNARQGNECVGGAVDLPLRAVAFVLSRSVECVGALLPAACQFWPEC